MLEQAAPPRLPEALGWPWRMTMRAPPMILLILVSTVGMLAIHRTTVSMRGGFGLVVIALALAILLFRFRAALVEAMMAVPQRQWRLGLMALCWLSGVAWLGLSGTEPFSDFAAYLERAHGLADTGTYVDSDGRFAYRPIGWPLFLAGLIGLGVDPIWGGGVANATFSTITLLVIDRWARESAGEGAARGAGLLWTLLPSRVLSCSVLGTEPLFTMLLIGGVYLLASVSGKPKHRAGLAVVGGSVVLGCATYVRPVALLVPAAVGLWGLATLSSKRMWGLTLTVSMAVVVAMLVPWGLRNQRQLGAFLLTTTNGGITLYLANRAGANGTFKEDTSAGALLPRGELAGHRAGNRKAWTWIVENPLDFLALAPRKWSFLWGDDLSAAGDALSHSKHPGWQAGARKASQVFYLVLIGLTAIAAWRHRKTALGSDAAVWLSVLLYFSLLHTLYHGQSRFHQPLLPLFCLLAAMVFSPRWPATGARAADATPRVLTPV